jgi:phage recombination protein Bet
MAVALSNQMVKYTTDMGQEMALDSAAVRNYLVSGKGNVSDQEIMMFLKLCEARGLNPFIRDCYLIKYDNNSPANIVTGKDYFTRKANMNPNFEGFRAGVIVLHGDQLVEREGTIVLKSEELIGGWAEVYRKDRKAPIKNTALLSEYNKNFANWKTMPATMIRKVPLVQSLREAFPEEFGGMYAPEEMPVDTSKLPDNVIDLPTTKADPPQPKQEKPNPQQAAFYKAMSDWCFTHGYQWGEVDTCVKARIDANPKRNKPGFWEQLQKPEFLLQFQAIITDDLAALHPDEAPDSAIFNGEVPLPGERMPGEDDLGFDE